MRRGANLKIDGLKEEQHEDLSGRLIALAAEIGARLDGNNLTAVYRVGKAYTRRPRLVIVKLNSKAVRDELYSHRFNLKGKDDLRGVWLNEDLNESSRKKHENLRTVINYCKEKKIGHKSHADGITVDGNKYNVNSLDQLPSTCSLSEAKTVVRDSGIFFHSEHSYLSNFYPCPVRYDGKVHASAEHAYQWVKATGNGEQIYLSLRDRRSRREDTFFEPNLAFASFDIISSF